MSLEDFRAYNKQTLCPVDDLSRSSQLPSPDTIFYKDFHFLDEPLINRKYL
jgi:hypothetical protein